MTPKQFEATRDALGWSNREIARRIGCDGSLPTRWVNGQTPVPPSIARWLKGCAQAIKALPVPTDWRQLQPTTKRTTAARPAKKETRGRPAKKATRGRPGKMLRNRPGKPRRAAAAAPTTPTEAVAA